MGVLDTTINGDFILSKLMIATTFGFMGSGLEYTMNNMSASNGRNDLVYYYRNAINQVLIIPDNLYADGFASSGTHPVYARDWQGNVINYKVDVVRETLYYYGVYGLNQGRTDGEYYYPPR